MLEGSFSKLKSIGNKQKEGFVNKRTILDATPAKGPGKPPKFSSFTSEPFSTKRTYAFTNSALNILDEIHFKERLNYNEILDIAIHQYLESLSNK
ncbi:MAG TPA: hypothetical protein VFC84_07360 [Desulfosporosinus sp.]|nr:hypothetical protein [Desulfosporosinus sp.]